MTSNETFPVATRQASQVIANVPTEILLQLFQDRTVVFVNQGKIGRMLQISPPTSSRRRNGERRDPFADDDEEQEQDISSNGDAHPPSMNDAFLPPVDASSTVTTLFGTSKNEEMRLLEQLYASQIAAILFAKAKQPQHNADEEGTSVQELREAKPVVVALGFKPAFLEGASMEEQRTRFKEVMELVNRAI